MSPHPNPTRTPDRLELYQPTSAASRPVLEVSTSTSVPSRCSLRAPAGTFFMEEPITARGAPLSSSRSLRAIA